MAKITSEQSGQATALKTWAEYRELIENEGDALAGRYVRATYKKASTRGTVRTIYLPLWNYVVDVSAPAMDLPFKVIGNDAFKALMKKWRPTLSRSWKVRKATGSIYPHVARRRGRLIMEMLWGDSLRIMPDPSAPSEWDFLHRIEIATQDDKKLVYVRDPESDAVKACMVNLDGFSQDTKLLDEWGTIPIFPMYRDGTGILQPKPDRTLLDMHISMVLMLTDTDFRRKYRTAILWRKSMMVEENKTRGGSDIEASPDAVAELGDGDSIGIVESSIRSTEDLDYIERFLRLAAKMLKLPPELFITETRAETGAAKGWDYRPLMELQQKDREEADEWLETFLVEARPILEAEGVVKAGEVVSVKTVPSKLPAPADPLQYAMGVEKLMQLGMTSPLREISIREGVGYAEAEKIVKFNRKQSRGIVEAPASDGRADEADDMSEKEQVVAAAAAPNVAPVPGDEVADNLSVKSSDALNGAQITAAVAVIQQIIAGQMPEGAGRELLSALGIEESEVDRMIKAMKGFKPKQEEPPPGG